MIMSFDGDKCDFSYRQEYINPSIVIERNSNLQNTESLDDQMNNSIPRKSLFIFVVNAFEDSRLDYPQAGTTMKIVHCTAHVYIRTCVTRAM